MEQLELQALIDLRAFLMKRYKDLDGKGNPGTAMIKQKDVATMIERSVHTLDDVLRRHVSFK
jgi:hypothetical protein